MCGSDVLLSQTALTSKNLEVGMRGPARNSARPSRPELGMNQLPSMTRMVLLPLLEDDESRAERAAAERAGGRWSRSGTSDEGGDAIATTVKLVL